MCVCSFNKPECMHVSVYMYIICPQAYDAYICLPLSLALTLPARLFVCPSVCVSGCLSVYLCRHGCTYNYMNNLFKLIVIHSHSIYVYSVYLCISMNERKQKLYICGVYMCVCVHASSTYTLISSYFYIQPHTV